MADQLRSFYGNIVHRFADMGAGADGLSYFAPVIAPQGKYNAALPTLTDGQRGDLQVDSKSSLRISVWGSAGTGANVNGNNGDAQSAGTTGLDTRAWLYVFNGTSWDRQVKSNLTARLLSSAATTNGTNVKSAAGNVHKIMCNVAAAADKFLKLYNKATAPTVGTDTPVLTILLPASTKNFQVDLGCFGHYFSTGIGYAITGAAADADTTALASGDVTALNILYS